MAAHRAAKITDPPSVSFQGAKRGRKKTAASVMRQRTELQCLPSDALQRYPARPCPVSQELPLIC
jgi:hypothetical protein